MDGKVDLDDYTELAANFGTGSRWMQGDSTYNGKVELGDFTILAGNFGKSPVLRRGGDTLEDLYISMLGYPEIYWGAKAREDIWWRFEEFESMNLGTPTAIPESLRGTIPEPAVAGIALLSLLATRRRRCAGV